jgi:hypothetical protein
MRIKVIKSDTKNVLEGDVYGTYRPGNEWIHLIVDTVNGEPFQYDEWEAYTWHNISAKNCDLIKIL